MASCSRRPVTRTSFLKSTSESVSEGRLRIECGLDCDSPTTALHYRIDGWMEDAVLAKLLPTANLTSNQAAVAAQRTRRGEGEGRREGATRPFKRRVIKNRQVAVVCRPLLRPTDPRTGPGGRAGGQEVNEEVQLDISLRHVKMGWLWRGARPASVPKNCQELRFVTASR